MSSSAFSRFECFSVFVTKSGSTNPIGTTSLGPSVAGALTSFISTGTTKGFGA